MLLVLQDVILFALLFYVLSPGGLSSAENTERARPYRRQEEDTFYARFMNGPLATAADRWALVMFLVHPYLIYQTHNLAPVFVWVSILVSLAVTLLVVGIGSALGGWMILTWVRAETTPETTSGPSSPRSPRGRGGERPVSRTFEGPEGAHGGGGSVHQHTVVTTRGGAAVTAQ